MKRIESRGVRCLECQHVELQGDKEAAKRGFGKCLAASPPPYVSVIAACNCTPFDRAPDDVVGPRDAWAAKLHLFHQNKSHEN